jgi:hypothetical protein
MALMTTAEVKAFLRETSTTYDTLIAVYIPLVEDDICEYLNNWFRDRVIFVESGSGLAFTRGNTATATTQADYITDDNDRFSTAGFAVGMDVVIDGGSNYGKYKIKTLTTAVMTITDTGEFISQDQDASYHSVGRIRISRIVWPKALKPIAAKMIWYQIDDNKPKGAISERIDDYSVTFAGARAYPSQLLSQLDKWKMVRTH